MEQAETRRYSFGEYEVDVTRRVLFRAGELVDLNPKSFDLLATMLERPGTVLSKNELLDAVWPEQYVEEKNLAVQIAALRKILGETKNENRFIATVPGKGYSFVAALQSGGGSGLVFETTRYTKIVVEEDFGSPGPRVERRLTGALKRPQIMIAGLCLIVVASVAAYWSLMWRASVPVAMANWTGPMKITKLTTTGNVLWAALSPDGREFAYITRDGGDESLWLGRIDGGKSIQLRPPENVDYTTPAFSPDGRVLYFNTSDRTSGRYALYRMPIFGGVVEKVIDDVPSPVAVSPDGQQIVFPRVDTAAGLSNIFVASTSTGTERLLASRSIKSGFNLRGSSWSPDGRMIAVSGISDDPARNKVVYGIDVESGNIRSLTTGHWDYLNRVVWLSSGDGLLTIGSDGDDPVGVWLISYPEGTARRVTSDINTYSPNSLSVSADGHAILAIPNEQLSNIWVGSSQTAGDQRQVTNGTSGRFDGLYGLDWAPGDRILYTAMTGKSQAIWSMNSDGSDQRQLTPDGHIDADPSVSDGGVVVFQSDRVGGPDIWRMNMDGGDLRPLTSDGHSGDPDISPDGKVLVYRSDSLWIRSADGGEPRPLTRGKASAPRFSPSGKLVACVLLDDVRPRIALIGPDDGKVMVTFEVPSTANLRNGLRWTPDGKAVTYRDWNDGVWRQSIGGGPPTRLPNLPKGKIYTYDWSPDGRRFAFTPAVEIRDVVLISDTK